MVDKVVLINTVSNYNKGNFIEPATENLGFLTIKEALRTKGFDNVVMFPDHQIKNRGEYPIGRQLESILEGDDVICGINATTDTFTNFTLISEIVRGINPEVTIVAGGPHFKREKWNPQDTIESTLANREADYVVYGHAEPFVNMVLEKGRSDGLYSLISTGLIGEGRGKYPEIERLPIIKNDGIVSTIIEDSCRNSCNFCSIDPQKMDISPEKIIKTLNRELEDAKHLEILGSNPFEPEKLDFYREILDSIRDIRKTCYLDPGLLADEKTFSEVVGFLLHYEFVNFFIGRDCVTEKTAKDIGSKYRGKIRDNEQLEMEKRGINKLLNVLNSEDFDFMVDLNYIISPFTQDPGEVDLITEDIKGFISLQAPHVKVAAGYSNLAPYPGTSLRKSYFCDIDKTSVNGNFWKKELPGYDLLNNMLFMSKFTGAGVSEKNIDIFERMGRVSYETGMKRKFQMLKIKYDLIKYVRNSLKEQVRNKARFSSP